MHGSGWHDGTGDVKEGGFIHHKREERRRTVMSMRSEACGRAYKCRRITLWESDRRKYIPVPRSDALRICPRHRSV